MGSAQGIYRIAWLTVAALLLLALTATGTRAFFRDTRTSGGNSIAAGTLDLVPAVAGVYSGLPANYTVTAGGDSINGNVVFSRVAPGQSGSIQWTLTNRGSLPGTLTLPSIITFSENGSVEPESLFAANNGGGNGDLDQYFLVTLQKGIGTNEASALLALDWINGSTPWAISGLGAVLNAQSTIMAARGGNDTVVYLLSWSLSADDPNINIVQGDSALVDITFSLSQ